MDISYTLRSLNKAAATSALMHIKPTFITYLGYVLPSHSTYLLSYQRLRELPLASKHLVTIFTDTQLLSCFETQFIF